jgi:hypothetical protein
MRLTAFRVLQQEYYFELLGIPVYMLTLIDWLSLVLLLQKCFPDQQLSDTIFLLQ